MTLRAELQAIVDALLAESVVSAVVSLDALGDAIGVHAVTAAEIDAMLRQLEECGRTIAAPAGGGGEERLKAVVAAARVLASQLGRPATLREIAAHSNLEVDQARHALTLLKIMQR